MVVELAALGLPAEDWTDIGNGVAIKPLMRYDSENEHTTEVVGLTLKHVHPDGQECLGSVPFHRMHAGGAEWEVRSVSPLTLHPSILQKSGPDGTQCLHGHIVEGRWVPC